MFKLLVGLVLALGGCGSDNCNLNTVCSPNSPYHYQLCNGGSADDCYYVTGDGHKFHCLTCGDCSEAQSLVTSWCSAQPNKPSGTTSTSGNLTCGGTASCPSSSRTYTACATTTGQCSYKTSDGTVFNCNSCSDCNAAVQNVLGWCSGNSGGTTGGGSDSTCTSQATAACQTCCGNQHTDGANYYADSYITCGCTYCGSSCTTAGDVCHGGSTQTSACASCLGTAVQQNCTTQLQNDCAANAACSAFLTCVSGC